MSDNLETKTLKEKVRDLVKEIGITQNDLAELLSITPQTLSMKVNEHKDFTRLEIQTMINYFSLDAERTFYIFFS